MKKRHVQNFALGYAAILTHAEAWLIWYDAPGREGWAIGLLLGSCLATAFIGALPW